MCDLGERQTLLLESASLICDMAGSSAPRDLLALFPGCRYALCLERGNPVIAHKDGRSWMLRPTEPSEDPDPALAASAIYALEMLGDELETGLEFTVTAAERRDCWILLPAELDLTIRR